MIFFCTLGVANSFSPKNFYFMDERVGKSGLGICRLIASSSSNGLPRVADPNNSYLPNGLFFTHHPFRLYLLL
jgi:hypothetical protein